MKIVYIRKIEINNNFMISQVIYNKGFSKNITRICITEINSKYPQTYFFDNGESITYSLNKTFESFFESNFNVYDNGVFKNIDFPK